MPQTRDCDYCGDEIPPGTGTMFVRTDGTTIHYCSSKCEKNAELGREPRDIEWIQDEDEAPAAETAGVEEEPDTETDSEDDVEEDAETESSETESEQEDAETDDEDEGAAATEADDETAEDAEDDEE